MSRGRPNVNGFLSREQIERVVRRHSRGIRYCYERQLADDPSLGGRISVNWTIDLDGRVSCVFGTHTHVPTADDRIFPQGTAFISDLGMTGPYDSVIGRKAEAVLHKFLTAMHAPFTVAEENVHLAGVLLEADPVTGKAVRFSRIDVRDHGAAAFSESAAIAIEGEAPPESAEKTEE